MCGGIREPKKTAKSLFDFSTGHCLIIIIIINTVIQRWTEMFDKERCYLLLTQHQLLSSWLLTDARRHVPGSFADLYFFFRIEKVLLPAGNIVYTALPLWWKAHLTFLLPLENTDLGRERTCNNSHYCATKDCKPAWRGFIYPDDPVAIIC